MWLHGSLAAVFLVLPCLAQQQAGAKALFHDPTSGVSLRTPGQKPAPRPVRRAAPAAKSEVTGLMYWLELLTEKGQVLRVNSNRIFRTGERVRLNVRSNVDGDLTILQSQDGAAPGLLFPPPGRGSAAIRANEDHAFPSRAGWFRFNEKPGAIRLMVMVRAHGSGGPAAAPLPGTAQNRTEPPAPVAAPTPPSPTPPAPSRSAPPAATAQTRAAQDAAYEAELKRQLDRLRGSKALVVEDDSSAGAEARYVVVDRRKDPAAPSGVVALEISLSHQAN